MPGISLLLGTACIYVSSAAPSKQLLGTTNGLAQTVASIQGTIIPAATDWLFAFSITNDVLGGILVYVVLMSGVSIGLSVAAHLPKGAWNQRTR